METKGREDAGRGRIMGKCGRSQGQQVQQPWGRISLVSWGRVEVSRGALCGCEQRLLPLEEVWGQARPKAKNVAFVSKCSRKLQEF